VDLSRWLGGPRTRTALDGATGAIMGDITALVAGLRGEEPPVVPFDPAVAAVKAAALSDPAPATKAADPTAS
jgi:1-acyl-sn-glycerol-3-phosphate acyltransferase